MTEPCFLYGSHASYHTAKTRSYLRKKGIPFVERLPSHPRFREHVRPTSGNHRIPQLELADGTVIQDSIAIADALEALHPEPSPYPRGPRQQIAVRLFEVLFDSWLGRPAWHYRWNFMEENYGFVGREFGRSFKPQGSNDEIDHYGRVIADRMEGKRAGMGATEEVLPAFEEIYLDALRVLEAHFTTTPYLFGGLPTTADHMLMGPLFGHLARDPVPATLMKQRAPRVFRWTEAMNTPELLSPEFAVHELAFDADDFVADTTRELLALCIADCADNLVRSAEMYNEWVAEQGEVAAGTPVSEKADEPAVGRFLATLRGREIQEPATLYPLWVLQRGLDWLAAQDDEAKQSCRSFLAELGGEALVDIRLARPLTRNGSFIALG